MDPTPPLTPVTLLSDLLLDSSHDYWMLIPSHSVLTSSFSHHDHDAAKPEQKINQASSAGRELLTGRTPPCR